MWYLAAIGAAAGGAFGYEQNRKQNQLIDDAARASQERVNEQELQLRKSVGQQNQASGWNYQNNQGAITNAIFSDQVNYQGGTSIASGRSIDGALATNTAQQIQGTAIRNENMNNQLKGMEYQKQNIRIDAQNSKTSDFNAIMGGVSQGLGMAGALSSGIQSFQQESINADRAAMQNDISNKVMDINNTVGPLSPDMISLRNNYVDQLQALNSGINPSLLTGPNASVVLQPFQQQRQLFEARQSMVDYTIQNEQARQGFNNRMFQNYVSNPLYNMGPGYQGVTNDTFFRYMSGR